MNIADKLYNFDGLTDRMQHFPALVILAILPMILFYSTILGDQQFMGHDTVQWRAGAESVIEYKELHDGEAPLWATHMFGGMPSHVVYQSNSAPHLDTLFNKLRNIWPAVPYWVLLGGLYYFFILQGFRSLTSVLGTILIGFTTYLPIIIGAGHNAKFIAFSFIPWMFCGYWLLTRTDKWWWGFFLFTVACTLEFRAGHPQVTYYFVFLFAGLFLYDSWQYFKNHKINEWSKVTALITTAVVLGLIGSAEQYWKLMEYSPYSIRGGSAITDVATEGGLSFEYAFEWSQGILETLTLLIPNLFGGDSNLAYWGEKPGTSGPHYMGAVTALLFLIAIFRSGKKIIYLFTGVGVLTMTFSWGHYFPLNEFWFYTLPLFDKFRTPEMWLIVTVFCFSLVAIYGLQSVMDLVKDGTSGIRKLYTPIAIAAGIGLMLLLLLFGNRILQFESERERNRITHQIVTQYNLSLEAPQVQQQISEIINTRFKPERRELAQVDILRYLFIIGAVALLIVMFIRTDIGTGILLLSLIVIASFDMLTVGNRYINERALQPASIDITDLIENQKRPVDSFIQENFKNPVHYPYRVFPLDDRPFENAIPNYFYPTIGGYSGAKLSIIQDFINEGLFTGPHGINTEALDMLNVKFISSRRELSLPGYTEVFREDEYRVYLNDTVLPKAWFVEEVKTVTSPRVAFNFIQPQKDFNPEQLAIVEADQEIRSSPAEQSFVTVDHYTARRLTLSVSRSAPGFMVLSEIYYPKGWTARLNGEEIPIYKTNYLLRGVEIPAGSHTLEFEFRPKSHTWGVPVSWAANIFQLIIGLVLLTGLWTTNRNRQDVNHEN